MSGLLSVIKIFLEKIKPNLILFVVLLFILAWKIMGHIIDNISDPNANQLIVGALLGILNQSQGEMRRRWETSDEDGSFSRYG